MRRTALFRACATILLAGLVLASAPSVSAGERRTVPVPGEVLQTAAKKRYSPAELASFDGSDPTRPILMAVGGLVFDVSEGRRFYATGERYHAFSGRDLTRAVARMSLTPADQTDDCSSLTDAEWEFLARVLHDTYLAKYPVVGHLAGGAFYPKGLCCQEADCGSC